MRYTVIRGDARPKQLAITGNLNKNLLKCNLRQANKTVSQETRDDSKVLGDDARLKQIDLEPRSSGDQEF